MTTHEINNLIARYLDGQTTPAEERQLALEVQRQDAPPEWRIIAAMLGELTRDEAIYDAIINKNHPSGQTGVNIKGFSPLPLGRVLRWAACLILVFCLSYLTMRRPPSDIAETPQRSPMAHKPHHFQHRTPEPAVQQEMRESPLPSCLVAEVTQPEAMPAEDEPSELPAEEAVDTEMTQMLLAEIAEHILEQEQSEERLHQSLIDEILLKAKELPNQPELTL